MAAVAVTAVLGVASLVTQQKAAKKAASARARALEEQRKARETDQANRENIDRLNRRKAVRQDRIRRAQIIQSSINTGVGGSSGMIGAGSVLGTNLGESVSESVARGKASVGIGEALQASAGYSAQAQNIIATGNLQAAVIKTVGGIGLSAIDAGLFDPNPVVMSNPPVRHAGNKR